MATRKLITRPKLILPGADMAGDPPSDFRADDRGSALTRRQMTFGLGAGVGAGLSGGLLGPGEALAGDGAGQEGGDRRELFLLAAVFVLLIGTLLVRPRGFVILGDEGVAATELPETADIELQDKADLSSIPLLGALQSQGSRPLAALLTTATLLAPIYLFAGLLIADMRRKWVPAIDVIGLVLGMTASLQGAAFMRAAMATSRTGILLPWLALFSALTLVFYTFHRQHKLVAYTPDASLQPLGDVRTSDETEVQARDYFAGIVEAGNQGFVDAQRVGELHQLEDRLVVSTVPR